MRIKRICYPVRVLGPGERIGIWTTGCNFNCKGCMTPELQNMNAGNEISVEKIIESIKRINTNNYCFTISGGEPFEQVLELAKLVKKISTDFSDDIIIYTGYTLEELRKKYPEQLDQIISSISVLIDGRYIDELNDDIGLRGSSNQTIHIFKNQEKYGYMNTCKRTLQVFDHCENYSLVIGIM